MMDMIGKLLGLETNPAAPVNPVQTNPKKPRKKLIFSDARRNIFQVAGIMHGVMTILAYLNNIDAAKAKLYITKALLRISQNFLTIYDRNSKRKK